MKAKNKSWTDKFRGKVKVDKKTGKTVFVICKGMVSVR
jgi:hypothetical protein